MCRECRSDRAPYRPKRVRKDTRRSTSAWQKARAAVLATATDCWICGDPLRFDVKAPHPLSPSVDHLTPLQHGGELLDPANLAACHLRCNVRRGNLTRQGRDVDTGPRSQCEVCRAWFDGRGKFCGDECAAIRRATRARVAARRRRGAVPPTTRPASA